MAKLAGHGRFNLEPSYKSRIQTLNHGENSETKSILIKKLLIPYRDTEKVGQQQITTSYKELALLNTIEVMLPR